MESQDENERARLDHLERTRLKHEAYATIFNNPVGKLVLDDIDRFCKRGDESIHMDREGRMVQPDFIVDVSRTVGTKRAMLAEHASQRAWLRAQHGTDDYLDQMEQWTRERGRLAGMEYGEGFRHYRGHPYPLSAMLEGLLGTAVGG